MSRNTSTRVPLREAFSITINVDGDGIPEQQGAPQGPVGGRALPADGGMFERYVTELAPVSSAASALVESARQVNRVVNETIEDLGLRENKREYHVGVSHANERVLRTWRAFVRELADFEKRFR